MLNHQVLKILRSLIRKLKKRLADRRMGNLCVNLVESFSKSNSMQRNILKFILLDSASLVHIVNLD